MNKEENKVIQKGMNYATFELKNKLTQVIQESEVPVINAKYVLIDLSNEMADITDSAIKLEEKAYQEALKEYQENNMKGEE